MPGIHTLFLLLLTRVGHNLAHTRTYLCSVILIHESYLFMGTSIIISPRVINTVNSLPDIDRGAISNAISMEFILGQDPLATLTPTQSMIYSIIRFYVKQDTVRCSPERKSISGFNPKRSALS